MEKIKSFKETEYNFGIKLHETNRKLWKTPKKIRYPLESLLEENYNPAIDKMLIKDIGLFGAITLKVIANYLHPYKELKENW